jgi:tyrosinase
MFNDAGRSSSISRRNVLVGTAALATAASLPRLGSATSPAKYRRWNISDPNCPPRVLGSYKKAIRAMLALPPTDPRNWYRYTLIHTLDCPHGNWWFLPWHRGYIGWFEQICRDLSGDPEFALPYWDWTKEPRVPKAMFDDVLDPNNSAFIASADAFKAQFKDAIAKASYWAMIKNPDGSLSPSPQYNQLLNRSIRFPDDLWFDIIDSPAGAMFFNPGHARGLSAAQPDLVIPNKPPEQQSVLIAVSISTILDALGPRDFLSFGSPKALSHSSSSGFGVLENQPHNLVHNCVGGAYNDVGGFMQAFMSPTDPIFYLHHTNIDRLWDVWTRKQLAKNYPILPDGYPAAPGQAPKKGSDYATWAAEPFVFFVDAKGNPVQQNTADAYASIGDFNYDYSPGSGDEVVPVTPQPPLVSTLLQRPLLAALAAKQVDGKNVLDASVTVPLALVQQQADPQQPKLFASVTVDLPPQGHEDLDVFIKRADGTSQFVAALSMFGHHLMHGPVTFLVPLSAALDTLQANQKFEASPTFNIQVVPRAKSTGAALMVAHVGAAATSGGTSEVTAISLQQL